MAYSIYDYSNVSALANGTTAGDAVAENATAPSSVNNALRGHKYYHKLWLDDQAGVNQTVGGTANAITLTTSQGFTAYGTLDGQIKNGTEIAFKNTVGPNTAATTINVNAIGIKKIRGQGDVALAGGEMVDDGIFRLRYDTAADAAAGAWILLNPAVTTSAIPDASTTVKGIIEIATNAEVLAGTSALLAVTPATAYFPTGFVYGLTLTTNGTDATNDIDIAAGAARSDDDTANMLRASTLVKQTDAAWAVGTNAGSLDTGAVGNNRYALWLIKRPDTSVVDVLSSLSFTAPTMPADYTVKALIGEFTRAGGVNGTPLWYGPRRAATGYDGITLSVPVAATSGTSIDFTGIPAWAKRITVNLSGVALSSTSHLLIQIGDAGGVETSGYTSASAASNSASILSPSSTAGFVVVAGASTNIVDAEVRIALLNPSTNLWVSGHGGALENAAFGLAGGGKKALSAVLDRVRITSTGGADTFTAGTINISYE
jgi:hypothetical protein